MGFHIYICQIHVICLILVCYDIVARTMSSATVIMLNMPGNTYHLTTAIPYVNGKPHIGHVLEWFQADVIARYQTLLGKDVSFTSGADENSLKNVQAAEKAGVSVQDWLDQYSEIFKDAYKHFGVNLTGFRRGSDQEKHWPGVQQLWKLCEQSGDIYTKEYEGLYCVGCETFYTPEELIDGKCPEHFTVPELVKETNYFFKLSKYENQIRDLISSDTLRIVSEQYKNEMLGFINQGLQDFSVSRSTERARGIGVPVPGDDSQVMYVWFDALAIYMTAIGWGYDQAQWDKYWPADVHIIGKGINRFHSVYWIGMLLSAGLPLPKAVSVHGYITVDGQKMGKSLGNVVDPYDLVEKFGLEPVRYYLLKEIPTHSDGDYSETRFAEVYTADLANGIGNLCSRVAKLAEKAELDVLLPEQVFNGEFSTLIENFEISEALRWVSIQVNSVDQYLSENKPWEKSGEEQTKILVEAITLIQYLAYHLQPFLPETSGKILTHFNGKISALQPLFPRLPQ
jgi:methionyl-tRNA synthetase